MFKIIYLEGNSKKLGFETKEEKILFNNFLFKIKNFTCLVDIFSLISNYFNSKDRLDDLILSNNTLKAFKIFLKTNKIPFKSNTKKEQLLKLIENFFKENSVN